MMIAVVNLLISISTPGRWASRLVFVFALLSIAALCHAPVPFPVARKQNEAIRCICAALERSILVQLMKANGRCFGGLLEAIAALSLLANAMEETGNQKELLRKWSKHFLAIFFLETRIWRKDDGLLNKIRECFAWTMSVIIRFRGELCCNI